MTGPVSSGRKPWFGSLVASCVLGLFVWIGSRELFEVIAGGWLRGRRGPGVSAADHPVLFWAIIIFIGAGVLLAAGLTLICAISFVRGVLGNRQTH